MVKGAIPFRDTIAAPGSDLHKALMENDLQKAIKIYNATTERMLTLVQRKKCLNGPTCYCPDDHD